MACGSGFIKMNEIEAHSPYRYGADQGLYFGLYLICFYTCGLLNMTSPNLLYSLGAMALFMGVPFLIYRWLRRTYVASRGRLPLSALWMQGIVIFICGTLIAALALVIYLKFINPTFIVDQMRVLIEMYSSMDWERGQEAADMLQTLIDMKLVPSAMSVVMETVWLGVFSGSILSLLMGLLARARKVNHVKDTNHFV